MIVCDIGNTNATFYEGGRVWKKSIKEFYDSKTSEKTFYICVNDEARKFVQRQPNYIDLEPFIEFDTIYQGMGIDRIAVCKAVDDGIVVDAGSAITIDVMSNGVHLGGCILPGLQAYEEAFQRISPILDTGINPRIFLDALPQNTKDAISYATINSIILVIKSISKNKKIYFTGGDGQYLSTLFENSIYDKTLIFRGLEDAYKKAAKI